MFLSIFILNVVFLFNVFQGKTLCFYAKPVVSIVSIVFLIICLAMQISYKE